VRQHTQLLPVNWYLRSSQQFKEFKKRESRYKIRKKTSKEEEVKNEFFQFVVVVVVIRRG
jgi:hypothetical protein